MLEASEVEALEVVRVVAEYVLLVFEAVEIAVDDSIETLELVRIVVSEADVSVADVSVADVSDADVTTELLLEG